MKKKLLIITITLLLLTLLVSFAVAQGSAGDFTGIKLNCNDITAMSTIKYGPQVAQTLGYDELQLLIT